MFYSKDLLAREQAVFYVVWQYATRQKNSVDKREVLKQKLTKLCESIMELIPTMGKSGTTPQLSLYLLAQLLYGTVLIYSKQVDFLQKDAEMLKENLRNKNLLAKIIKEFEKHEKRKERLRSLSAAGTIDLNAELGMDINLIPDESLSVSRKEITLTEDLPFPTWKNHDLNEDLIQFYSPINDFSSGDTFQRTFVESNNSEESNRGDIRNASSFFAENLEFAPVPNRDAAKSGVRDIDDSREKRNTKDLTVANQIEPAFVDPLEQTNLEGIAVAQPEERPQIVAEDDILRNAPDVVAQPPEQPSKDPFIDEVRDQFEIPPQVSTPFTPINDGRISILTPTPLENERIRSMSVHSRPITPKLHDSTLQTPLKRRFDETLELDSQIFMEPIHQAPRRKNPKFDRGDLQISKEEMKAMEKDYSSLLKDMRNVMIKEPNPNELTIEQLFDPSPYYINRKRFPEMLRSLYGPGRYNPNIGTTIEDEDDESSICSFDEKDERFAKTFLLESPQRTIPLENNDISNQKELTNTFLDDNQHIIISQLDLLPIEEINTEKEKEEEEPVGQIRRREKSTFGIMPEQIVEQLEKDPVFVEEIPENNNDEFFFT
ncbi:unnamed protein product [Caenorhabditis bovis]|uniref:Rad21/Rec8-like protein N-terminal domain-containing protein n=1 Tax=Caenorhabditis bovis TaxID=2654633 RepID=A0A8S1F2C5_9PELO|nr:unnamed protein product [Caenorhabditis bovis]